MKPAPSLRQFSTDELIEELARRAQANPTEKPKHWCDECAHFVAWVDKQPLSGGDCPLDYNPCTKGHAMAFIAPKDIGDDYGFYRAVCQDRELSGAPRCGATSDSTEDLG